MTRKQDLNILQRLFDAFIDLYIEEITKEQQLDKNNAIKTQIESFEDEIKKSLKTLEQLAIDQDNDDYTFARNDPDPEDTWEEEDPVEQKSTNIGQVAIKRQNQDQDGEPRKKLNIHYSNLRLYANRLPSNVTDQELADYFSKYGEVEDVSFKPNQPFAFITFKHFYEFPPYHHKLKGKEITVAPLNPPNDPNVKSKTVVANGVFTNLSVESLKKYFSQYGSIETVQKVERYGTFRCAFIKFKNYDSVEEAIKKIIHIIEGHIVDIRKATREYEN